MGFLSGSVGFERLKVTGFDKSQFGDAEIEILSENKIRSVTASDTELIKTGFLAGNHLFDTDFQFGKNVINDALHFAVRIDTNQIPAAIKKAWMQIELAGITKDNESRRITKAQREEAKDAVEARCQTEAATGKYRKMATVPGLWDLNSQTLYFGGTSAAAYSVFTDLFSSAFQVGLELQSAGTLAVDWASDNELIGELENSAPSEFIPEKPSSGSVWADADAANFDFLGNEFLIWLWWSLEHETDTLQLADESEVAVMLNRTLQLECPFGEHGKQTLSAEAPNQLPEALRALQSGKLPRKSGLALIRRGFEFNLVLQPERFAVSSAKIKTEERDPDFANENRIESIRYLGETLDLVYGKFLSVRLSKGWSKTLKKMQRWLTLQTPNQQKSAA